MWVNVCEACANVCIVLFQVLHSKSCRTIWCNDKAFFSFWFWIRLGLYFLCNILRKSQNRERILTADNVSLFPLYSIWKEVKASLKIILQFFYPPTDNSCGFQSDITAFNLYSWGMHIFSKFQQYSTLSQILFLIRPECSKIFVCLFIDNDNTSWWR